MPQAVGQESFWLVFWLIYWHHESLDAMHVAEKLPRVLFPCWKNVWPCTDWNFLQAIHNQENWMSDWNHISASCPLNCFPNSLFPLLLWGGWVGYCRCAGPFSMQNVQLKQPRAPGCHWDSPCPQQLVAWEETMGVDCGQCSPWSSSWP